MSGHSRWAKVKHFKGAIDAKRGKIFSKLGKEITIAVKLAGSDPEMNPRLRMVLLKSRAANMPNDNIERAIKRGAGDGAAINYEELTYEVYGPHGVAILVELSTDNRNRTASEIRSLLTKNGGTIATAGSVTRLFQRKGQIIVTREAAEEDPLMEAALEAGAEDFKTDPQGYEILTDPARFEAVHKAIEGKGIQARRGGSDLGSDDDRSVVQRQGGGRSDPIARHSGRPRRRQRHPFQRRVSGMSHPCSGGL